MLEVLLGVVSGDVADATLAGYPVRFINSLNHGEKPRDIHVTARSAGSSVIRFSFGSNDSPTIDYALQILGRYTNAR